MVEDLKFRFCVPFLLIEARTPWAINRNNKEHVIFREGKRWGGGGSTLKNNVFWVNITPYFA